ncbi:uncharacterized protein LAESUDRAFT_426636 [Laetiporus sulphureus 93-53]|uniref:Uncharacterized protein n=1 Tax=Laetiporus sulphureus 93-53 TaxID=1314785 RepID=A0A165GKB8_9APHY|nr:uncharacterized protein LAESUDRAFT_426636 [Laetiporus sulphureus 93-53]KZT10472.1 hypothetical protein LAESUDRAFT_426636 [Laetiporus sulphureus 93-53]
MTILKRSAFSFSRPLTTSELKAPNNHRRTLSAKMISAPMVHFTSIDSFPDLMATIDGAKLSERAYVYETPLASVREDQAFRSEHHCTQSVPLHCEPTVPQHFSLVSLTSAQCRNDIRRRVEGFEMARIDSASRTRDPQLIPLKDAFFRDDIRRRGEGFEQLAQVDTERVSRMGSDLLEGDEAVIFPWSADDSAPLNSPSPQLSATSTLPSVYSQGSWAGNFSDDGLPCSSEVVSQRVLERTVEGVDGDVREAEAFTSSGSSFDEESFLRMAASLGW